MRANKAYVTVGAIGLGLSLASATIDLGDLFPYAEQEVPAHIALNSMSPPGPLTDEVATLGRVLFYDKRLSSDNTVACATCHQQAFAFGTTELQGPGVNGPSLRRPMRLVNVYASEAGLFWDERAADLEDLALQPIQDHLEMGYSGTDGDPGLDELMQELAATEFYAPLFTLAFGDAAATPDRVASALAQFVRSFRSYDSRFDAGMAAAGDIDSDFATFSAAENAGKALFITDPVLGPDGTRVGGGAGCFHCHEVRDTRNFHFLSEGRNNGVITEIDGTEVLGITRAPSLRDVFGPGGTLNGPLFHNGQATSFGDVLDHYADVPPNPQLDHRANILGTHMAFTTAERQQLEAFVKTLTGTALYVDEKWSDPFDANGDIEIIEAPSGIAVRSPVLLRLAPNPARETVRVEGVAAAGLTVRIVDNSGSEVHVQRARDDGSIDVVGLRPGLYTVQLVLPGDARIRTGRFVKL